MVPTQAGLLIHNIMFIYIQWWLIISLHKKDIFLPSVQITERNKDNVFLAKSTKTFILAETVLQHAKRKQMQPAHTVKDW